MTERRTAAEVELLQLQYYALLVPQRALVERFAQRLARKLCFQEFHYKPARERFRKLDLVDTIAGAAKLALWVVLKL